MPRSRTNAPEGVGRVTGDIVLAVRASPDWAALAADHASGRDIATTRYMPADNPHFPRDMPDHIARWNKLSNISFFACRDTLRTIAARNLARVAGVRRMRAVDIAPGDAPALIFYHDDDDWFHPDLGAVLRGLGDLHGVDAVVLPFYRIGRAHTTFTQGGRPVADALGPCAPFRYRYCTNNAGLTRRARRATTRAMIEHIDASDAADAHGFVDRHHHAVLSATSKTPCSAGWVRELPDGKAAFRKHVAAYVRSLETLRAVSRHDWINVPLDETCALFQSVLGD